MNKKLNYGEGNDPEKTVVHCPTEELARKVLAIAHEAGLEWDSRCSYADIAWKYYKEHTCYHFQEGAYGSLGYYKSENFTILSDTEFIRLNTPPVIEQPDAQKRNPFKVGDRVWHPVYGWSKVERSGPGLVIIEGIGLAVEWQLLSFTEYTLEGFSQERPVSLPDIKIGQLIYVRVGDGEEWRMRYFSGWKEGVIYTFQSQRKTGTVIGWDQYSLTNPLEEK